MGLRTPPKVRKLQRTLYAKAKEEPGYRFYLLYDKIYREDVLELAYRKSRANGGAPGVDGRSFGQIEKRGRERWLRELAQELREKRYRAQPVRRVWIEKEDGGRRPLGIPTIKDRVVQMAAVLVLGPIFEADFEPEQYGYRPKRRAQDAVVKVHELLRRGHREVVDADLSGYFDAIPHRELIKSVARRISDKHVLKLIKRWLKAPVREEDRKGPDGTGTPQGSPLSPLLANLYMRRLVLAWKKLGFQQRYQAHLVNYADDFVVCCRRNGEQALEAAQAILRVMKVRLNERKTQLRRAPDESFDFLGYTIGRCYSAKTGRCYIGTRPSKARIRRFCRQISEATRPTGSHRSESEMVETLNRMLRGWANYFQLGPVSKAYRAVDAHTRERLRRWLRRKHKARKKGKTHFPDQHLYDRLGLVRLELRTRNLPWAKA